MTLQEQIKIDKQFAKYYNNNTYYLLGYLCSLFFSTLLVIFSASLSLDDDILALTTLILACYLVLGLSYMYFFIYTLENHHNVHVISKLNCIPIDKHIFILAKYILLLRMNLLVLAAHEIISICVSIYFNKALLMQAILLPCICMCICMCISTLLVMGIVRLSCVGKYL